VCVCDAPPEIPLALKQFRAVCETNQAKNHAKNIHHEYITLK